MALKLREQRSDGKYRWVRHWEAIPVSYCTQASPHYYLLLHADIVWNVEPQHPEFTILMQRSHTIGDGLDLQHPVHIEPEDAAHVARQFSAFVERYKDKDPPPPVSSP